MTKEEKVFWMLWGSKFHNFDEVAQACKCSRAMVARKFRKTFAFQTVNMGRPTAVGILNQTWNATTAQHAILDSNQR
jgi:hypothetical protein